MMLDTCPRENVTAKLFHMGCFAEDNSNVDIKQDGFPWSINFW